MVSVGNKVDCKKAQKNQAIRLKELVEHVSIRVFIGLNTWETSGLSGGLHCL